MRNPYITGSFVTGSHHYGRIGLLDYLLHGESRAYWVVGNRRIGKTSLLRQLEWQATQEDRLMPLFWDLQGCRSFGCIGEYLVDAIRDRAEQIEALGITPAALPADDALALLTMLRRQAVPRGGGVVALGR